MDRTEFLERLVRDFSPEMRAVLELLDELEGLRERLAAVEKTLENYGAKYTTEIGALEWRIEKLETPADRATKVRTTQTAAKGKHRHGHTKGNYCVECGRDIRKLSRRRVFCSGECMAAWKKEHGKYARPKPLMEKPWKGFEASVVAGEGVTKGSVSTPA